MFTVYETTFTPALLFCLCSIIPIVVVLLIIKANFEFPVDATNRPTDDETSVPHAALKVQEVVVFTATFIQP